MELNWQHIPTHHRRMTGFLIAAVILHSLILFVLHASGYGARPQLPDWMNIKLVAGIDESIETEAIMTPQKPLIKPKPVEHAQDADEQAETETVKPQQQAQAQHFVKADSRPYEHENPKPFYPAAARRRGMQGLVLLQVEVDIRGKVSNIDLKKSSGYRLLDEAAVSTVRTWRFIPAKENDQPVRSIVEVPIKFELTQF